ncbi:MAG TPA: hypothetical protein VFF06_00290 [Polyangia bacterium]|nr:hypothetical protein [Polyangia bacterium]
MTDRFCRKSRLHFSDRLDGLKVPFWRGLVVRLHLAVCPQCIRYNRSLAATRDALRSLRDSDPDPDPR